jgi:hypothetical protein
VVTGDTMTNSSHTTGISVDIATNRTAHFPRMDGVVKSSSRQRVTNFTQGESGLHDHHMIIEVDGKDLVHQIETDDNAPRHRSYRTRQAGPRTSWGKHHLKSTCHVDDLSDLFSGGWSDDGKRFDHDLVERLIVQVVWIVMWRETRRIYTNNCDELIVNGRRRHLFARYRSLH